MKARVLNAWNIIEKIKDDIGQGTWDKIIHNMRELKGKSKVLLIILVVNWNTFESNLMNCKRILSRKEKDALYSILNDSTLNGVNFNLEKLIFLAENIDEKRDIVLEDADIQEWRDNWTIYGFLSKTREEPITEELSEDDFVNLLYQHSEQGNQKVLMKSLIL